MYDKLKLYYHNYDDDDGIPSDTPIEVSMEKAIEYMEELPESEGNFVGFVLPSGDSVQFMYNDDDKNILLDIPDNERDGTYTKIVDFNECIQIIEDVFQGKNPKEIHGIEFESWS